MATGVIAAGAARHYPWVHANKNQSMSLQRFPSNHADETSLEQPGAATAVLSLPAVAGCNAQLYAVAWDGPAPQMTDDRLRALAYAVLAPNAHNTQPWLLDLRRPSEVDLYVDRRRTLLRTDPLFRQVHISHGTFLELLDMACRELGYAPEIAYFPQGEYGADVLADKPTAAIRFVPSAGANKDPLFAQIVRRISNRRAYEPGERLAGPSEQADERSLAGGGHVHRDQRAAAARELGRDYGRRDGGGEQRVGT